MKNRLYYKDQYHILGKCEVIDLIEKGNKNFLVLSEAPFFPGGGGQFCDEGEINNQRILNILEEDSKILIQVEKPIQVGTKVNYKVDFNRRLDGMQQHLAQHLLSGCFFSLYNHNTCGIHIGDEISTVDIVGLISEEEIIRVESYANELIQKGIDVEVSYTNRREAKRLGLRRDLATKDEEIRIVKIGELDINACCGIHPLNTRELQLIKIKGYEKHKGNTRITYLSGNRAVKDYMKNYEVLKSLCNNLNCGIEDLENTVKNLKDGNNLLRGECSTLKARLNNYEVKELINGSEEFKGVKIIKAIYENEEPKALNKLVSALIENENIVALLATKDKDKCNLVFGASKNLTKMNIGLVLKDAITLVDGKGGGTKLLAQGGGKNTLNINSAIDYAIRKVKEDGYI